MTNGEGGKADAMAKALDERPYTTLSYANGPGALAVRDAANEDRPRRDLSEVDTAKPEYLQQALIPLSHEMHGGEDVPIYAVGPWAQLFQRTVEQNYIYHVMRYAALEQPKAAAPRSKKTQPKKSQQ
jgi:alkaline phosphatase